MHLLLVKGSGEYSALALLLACSACVIKVDPANVKDIEGETAHSEKLKAGRGSLWEGSSSSGPSVRGVLTDSERGVFS